jgi:hypothetical protein
MTPLGMPTPLKVTMVADRHGRYHVVDPSAAAKKVAAADAKRARRNAKRAAAAAKVGA